MAVRCRDSLLRRAQIGARLQGLRLQIFEIHFQRLVIESPGDVVIRGHRFVSEQLPQIRKALHLGKLRLRDVRLELQQLQLDLQVDRLR